LRVKKFESDCFYVCWIRPEDLLFQKLHRVCVAQLYNFLIMGSAPKSISAERNARAVNVEELEEHQNVRVALQKRG